MHSDPYTGGRADGSILLIRALMVSGFILLIRTRAVEQSIRTVYKFCSFQLTGLSLLFNTKL